jgi:hypothetical protein
VIGLITGCLVDVVAVMGDVLILVYNFHVPLSLKVSSPSSGASCDIALVSLFLCVGLIAIFLWCYVLLRFPFYWCAFVVSQSCGVSRLLVEFLRVKVSAFCQSSGLEMEARTF